MIGFRSAVLTAFLFLLAMVPVHAEEGGRVVLVLDASGSMWGQIDGKTKMEIAKDVVGKVVGNWKPADELGLVAYGHREKGSCTDIEVLREAGPLDAADYMSAVKALNPKGKTPMTAAVRMAAESLKFTEKKATVILVSDGIETCDVDPCAVAEELEKLGVNLTVHTVGFGLDNKGAVAQLQCLAEKTGGTYSTADNANELQEALTKTVEAKVPEPAPEPAAPKFNLVGHVVMAEGVELPAGYDSASWDFFAAVDGQRGPGVGTEYGVDVKTNLPKPGDYIAKVSVDLAVVEAPVKIMDGKSETLDISLEAGVINLSGTMDGTLPLTDPGTTWELLDANSRVLATKYNPEVSFLAAAGAYKIRLKLGTAVAEQDVKIDAGKTIAQSVSLGAGIIEASGVFSAGGPAVPDSASIELRKGEAGLDGKHEWITTTYGSSTQFKVAAGKYLVIFAQDYASGSAVVDVKAAGVAKVGVDLNGGYLAVAGPADSTLEIFSGTKDISGKRQYIATEYGGAVNKAFSAGSYHVVAKSADGTVIGEKDFDVKAGARSEGAIP
jgi:Ca-activated chloride channel homolog